MPDDINDETKYQQNAIDSLTELFNRYNLGSLAPKIVEMVQEYGPENTNTILLKLQDTEEYKRRFIGNEYRKREGLPVLSPAEYLAQEAAYREVMRRAGLPEGFYDQIGDFGRLFQLDISPSELGSRAQAAVDLALTVDPEQRRALAAYGINASDLAAYFLDYERGLPQLQAKYDKALLDAERLRAGYGLDQEFADELYSAGLKGSDVRQGYSKLQQEFDTDAKLGEIYRDEYTLREGERATFLGDADALKNQRRLRSRERAAFSGRAGTSSSSLSRDDTFR